jgi:hypothetical protein
MTRSTRIVLFALCLSMVFASAARAAGIAGKYTGRYQCQQWNTLELEITESANGRLSGVFTFSLKSIGQNGTASYSMTGQYDAASGRFQLVPERWVGRPPRGVTMVGLSGTLDAATGRLSGKVEDFNCATFELAPPGVALAPPPPPAAAPLPPERRRAATDVTGFMTPFEYWDTALSDAPGTVRESEPIDEVIDWLRKEKFSCMDTAHVSWNPGGTRGSAGDVVLVRERYVIECTGDCRNVRYLPGVNASVLHFGTLMPAPVLEIKSPWLGGSRFRWDFIRDNSTATPPDIYIHRWTASTFNDKGACRAPKAR